MVCVQTIIYTCLVCFYQYTLQQHSFSTLAAQESLLSESNMIDPGLLHALEVVIFTPYMYRNGLFMWQVGKS